MANLHPSAADEADIELYTQGSCHAFAMALHRNLGMSFLVVTDPDSVYWQDEADADNVIHSVTHVFAVDGDGMAWDVLGARPLADVDGEILDRHPDVGATDEDSFSCEKGLVTYVDGMGEDIDRPLHAVSDSDVEEAWASARRVLCDVPGFPVFDDAPRI